MARLRPGAAAGASLDGDRDAGYVFHGFETPSPEGAQDLREDGFIA